MSEKPGYLTTLEYSGRWGIERKRLLKAALRGEWALC
jgi:hypothetical protein